MAARLIGLVGVLLALVACAAPSGPAPAAPVEVTVRDVSGEVTVPVTDTGIYAMDEWSALQLLSVGVKVDAAVSFFTDPTAIAVLKAEGVEVLEQPSVEAVLGRRPSLVVGIGHPNHIEQRPTIEPVVPMVLPDYTISWEEQLTTLARVVGREDRAAAVIARMQQRLDDLRADVTGAGLTGRTVSIMEAYPDGTFFAFGPTSPPGQLVESLGLARPPTQTGPGDFGFIAISPERLPEQRGDYLVALKGAFTEGVSVLDQPLAPTDGARVAEVDAGAWNANTPLGAWWVLGDLRAVLLDEGEVTATDDAVPIWNDLTGPLT